MADWIIAPEEQERRDRIARGIVEQEIEDNPDDPALRREHALRFGRMAGAGLRPAREPAFSDDELVSLVSSTTGVGAETMPGALGSARVGKRRYGETPASTDDYEAMVRETLGAGKADAPAKDDKGFWGDIKGTFAMGFQGIAQDARELARKSLGDGFVEFVDNIDEMIHGKKSEELLNENVRRAHESLTPQMQDALQKKWWDDERDTFGEAFSDPRAYIGGLVQSLPGTAITMLPGVALARGMYVTRMAGAAEAAKAGGLTGKAAEEFLRKQSLIEASRAATAAQISGSVIEGLQGGAQSSREVRDTILKMDESVLQRSDAYQALLSQGMAPEQARAALAEDASTQALVTGGIVTGIFGGAGDRVLGSAITKGLSGNIATRFLKGAVAEGALEEFPQSYGQRVAENVALQSADPTVQATQGALGEGLGGGVVGSIMGGGMAAPFRDNTPAEAPKPKPKPNSPLTRAADAAAASAPAVPPSGPPGAPSAGGAQAAPDDTIAAMEDPAGFGKRLSSAQFMLEDKELLRAIRADKRFGGESVTELLHAWALARNPTIEPAMRERAMAGIESFFENFGNRPDFTMEPGAGGPGTAIVPAGPGTDVSVRPQDDFGAGPPANPPGGGGGAIDVPGRVIEGEGTRVADRPELARPALPEPSETSGGTPAADVTTRPALPAPDLATAPSGTAPQTAAPAFMQSPPTPPGVPVPTGRRYTNIDDAIADGYKRDGRTLVHPKTKKRINLNAAELAYYNERKRRAIEAAAHEAATSPKNDKAATREQILGGNAELGHPNIGGLNLSIENPEGSERVDLHHTPPKWKTTMRAHYGYVKGVAARAPDKEHVDVYVRPRTPADYAGPVFVVEQNKDDGSYDEPKAMIGWPSAKEALAAYLQHYEPGWESHVRSIVPMTWGEFRNALNDPKHFLKPRSTQKTTTAVPAADSERTGAPRETEEQPVPAQTVPAADGEDQAPEREGMAAGEVVVPAQEQALPPDAPVAGVGDVAARGEGEVAKANWQEGQHLAEQAANFPHPLAPEWAHAEADLPNVPPVAASTVAQPADEAMRKRLAPFAAGPVSGPDLPSKAEAQRLRKGGYLEVEGGKWRLTEDGRKALGDPVQAQHVEPGKTEPATPAAITASLKEADRNTSLSLREAKKGLLAEIDQAIAAAPSGAETGKWNRKEGRLDAKVADPAKDIGYLTFDVPGDGKFRVLNLKETLERFKSNVNRSGGFSTPKPDRFAGPTSNPAVTVRDMLDDGEMEAAHALASTIGEPFRYGASSLEGVPAIVYTNAKDHEYLGIKFFIGRRWSSPNQKGNGGWDAIEGDSGMALGAGSTANEALILAKGAMDRAKAAGKLESTIANAPKVAQAERDRQWLAWAAEQDRNYTNREQIAARAQAEAQAIQLRIAERWNELTGQQIKPGEAYGHLASHDRFMEGLEQADERNRGDDFLKLPQEARETMKSGQGSLSDTIEFAQVLLAEREDAGGIDGSGWYFRAPDRGDGWLRRYQRDAGDGDRIRATMDLLEDDHWTATIRDEGRIVHRIGERAGTSLREAREQADKFIDGYLKQQEAPVAPNEEPEVVVPEGYKQVGESYFGGTVTKPIYGPFAKGEKVRDRDTGWTATVESFFTGQDEQRQIVTKYRVKYDNGAGETVPVRRLEAVTPTTEQPAQPAEEKPAEQPARSSFERQIANLRQIASRVGWSVMPNTSEERFIIKREDGGDAMRQRFTQLTVVRVTGGRYQVEVATGERGPKRGINAMNIEGQAVEFSNQRALMWDDKRVWQSNEIFPVLRDYIQANPGHAASDEILGVERSTVSALSDSAATGLGLSIEIPQNVRELLAQAEERDIVPVAAVRQQFDRGEGMFDGALHTPTPEQIAEQVEALKVARMGKETERNAISKYEGEVDALIAEALDYASVGRTLNAIATRKAAQAPDGATTAGSKHREAALGYINSSAAALRKAQESAAFLAALKQRNPADRNFRDIDRLNPLTAPVEDGDWFKIDGTAWQARNGYTGRGWALIDADKKTHPTIHDITANSDLIAMIVKEADAPAIAARKELRKFSEGTTEGMKSPLQVTFVLRDKSDYFFEKLRGIETPQAKYDYLQKARHDLQIPVKIGTGDRFGDQVDLNRVLRNGVQFGAFELAPRRGFVLATATIDLKGESKGEPAFLTKAREKVAPADGKSRAVSGGQEGINGYFYKGGQFLPSTMAAPGKWKVDGKWVSGRKEQVAPDKWENQPTPFSRSIYSFIGAWVVAEDGKLSMRQGIRGYDNNPITLETEIRPGVKGVLGKESLTLGEFIDAFNNGQRWFDVKPDAETVTVAEPAQLTAAPEAAPAAEQSGQDGAATPDANTFTEAEALKRMGRSDGGTSGGIKTYAIEFYDADANMETGRGGARHAYIEQSVGRGGDKKFRVYSRGGDYLGQTYENLKTATEAAKQASLVSIREDGYINTEPDSIGWDAMTLAEREALVVKAKWTAGKDNHISATGRTIAARAWADMPNGTRKKLISYHTTGHGLRYEATQEPAAKESPAKSKFADYDAVAREYGYQVMPDGTLASEDGKESGLRMSVSKGRFRVESKKTGDLTFSGDPNPETIGRFVEKFWDAEKKNPAAPEAAAAAPDAPKEPWQMTADYPERHGFKKLLDGSEPASTVTGEQPAYAGQSEKPAGQTTPNARGQSDSGLARGATKPERIDDAGTKIGGARKDLASSTGQRTAAGEKDDTAGWRKRYEVAQIVKGDGEGRWTIHDTRKKDYMGRHAQIGGHDKTFATREEAEAAVALAEVARNHVVIGETVKAPTEAEVDAMLAADAAVVAAEDSGARIAQSVMGRARKALDAGEITQEQFQSIEAKYGALAASYKPAVLQEAPRREVEYAIWRNVSDRKRVQVVAEKFFSREDAMRYMAQHAVEIIETKTSFGEEILPRPDKVVREGAKRREGDVTGDDFLRDFGFRAVEFGNWQAQDERQTVMNHAYDALMDLADVLGVPPRALGLNGELALAFGARGQGLIGARAHYERDYGVINLTKMKGAGSLAHEWMHAADHYFGRQAGKASGERVKNERGDLVFKAGSRGDDYASYGIGEKSGMRDELRTAYNAMIDTMLKKAEQYVEDTQKADRFVAEARKDVETRLRELRAELAAQKDQTYWKRNNKPASAEQLAAFDEIADKMLAGEHLEIEWRRAPDSKALKYRYSNDGIDALSALYKQVRGRSGFHENAGPLDRLAGDLRRYGARLQMLATAQAQTVKERKVPTSFAMEAKRIDQGRASDYWATPHEMAARAFQAYVEDKVAERGGRSDFLTYGTHTAIPTPWGWARPFPEGEERKAINAAFDRFVQTLRTKETDDGTVMYSLAAPAEGESFAQEVLSELAEYDELFRYPVSHSRSLTGVMADIDPTIEYIGDVTRPDEKAESGADTLHQFRTLKGRTFFVFERGNEVWIDVSRLDEGDRGSAIYHAVANYAYNTRKVFIGDPKGLSNIAVIRRTSAMLSSALRFGTTRHLDAAPEQIAGIPSEQIAPLDWRGSDVEKVRALIHTFLETVHAKFPQIQEYRYDFGRNQFVDHLGRPVDAARFEFGGSHPLSREAGAGRDTLRRAVFLQSLVRETQGRPGILERVLRGGRQFIGAGHLGNLFSLGSEDSTTAGTPDSIRAALVARFGESGIAALERAGLLNIITADEAPLRQQLAGANAYYVPTEGAAYLIADRLTPETAAEAVLHELGEHHGLATMLGERGWNALKARVRMMARIDGSLTQAAWEGVKENYGEFEGLDDAALGQNDRFIHEVVAKVGQTDRGRATTLWRDLLALVKRFLLKMGLPVNLTDADLHALVRGSLAKVMREAGGPGPRGGAGLAEPAMANMQRSERKVTVARMARFIAEYRAGRVKKGDTQLLGDAPNVLRALGIPPLPLEITGKAMDHVLKEKHSHEITPSMIAEAMDHLYDPVMVFKSKTEPDSVVAVTEVSDRRGKPVVVSLHLGQESGRLRVHRVTSVYGKEDAEQIFGYWADEGLLRYYSKQKALTPTTTNWLYLPYVVQLAEGSRTKPITDEDVVKQFGPLFSVAERRSPTGLPESRAADAGSVEQPARPYAGLDSTVSERRQSTTGAPASLGDNDGIMSSIPFDLAGRMNAERVSIAGESGRNYTPAQRAMFRAVGRETTQPSMNDRIKALWKDAGKKLAQGLVDQFAPVRAISENAYALLRLSKGAVGAFEAFLKHGKLRVDQDGAYDADTSGGAVDSVFVPLQNESEDFLWWVAANRAERLSAEDREHLFSDDDIAAGKSLADGELSHDFTLRHDHPGHAKGTTTRSRALAYRDSLLSFNEFHKNALDVAEASGLIDGEARQFWEHEFYVPFYRIDEEEGGVRGMSIKSGVVRQEAFKHLKGGTNKLNSDLLANTLQNWAHLIDAAAKNRAARATLKAAAKMGAARRVPAGTKGAVWYAGTLVHKIPAGVEYVENGVTKVSDGTAEVREHGKIHYAVDDPFVLTAISSLEYAGLRGPLMDAMSKMKRWLTVGVTASPAFKIRNLIRDSIQAIGTSALSPNIVQNWKEGYAATDRATQDYVSMLASGGLIRFGTMLEGNDSSRVKQLIKQGVGEHTILDSESKIRRMYDEYIEPAIMAYNELGNRGEEINRAALYKQLRAQGKDHLYASLMARDLLDFSMQGAWTGVRFLTQVVPFLNARMQGLYKLGRSAQADPQRLAAVVGAVALFSIALMLAQQDDDDWKRREDWDRDNYWWVKLGGVAFRIPKPFEVGAIGTLAERGVELFASPEMTGKRFMQRFRAILSDNLSMNPVPQMVKPILDLYANKDSFTGRPIETMGMERLQPEYRYNAQTTMPARALSTAGNAVTDMIGADFLSPVQIDQLIRGYFGWLGSFIVGAADFASKPIANEPTRPTIDYWKLATQNFIQDVEGAPSRYVTQLYDQAKELEQAHGTWRDLIKRGRLEEAQKFAIDNAEMLARYRSVEHAKQAEAKLNLAIRLTENDRILSADEKRKRILSLQKRKDAAAHAVVLSGM